MPATHARCCLLVLVVLAPWMAGAQTTTADGVQALARGDYATAARILRPIAEGVPQPDPLALFFLATLYHTGHGVAADPIRACGLYLKAATPTNPLRTQSLALAQTIQLDDPFMRDQCATASRERWGEPPATTFRLGPDHEVRIDPEGFVVGYEGTHTRALIPMSAPGWVFLPTRYTRLDVSRPVATRRHFIEFFIWMPDTSSAAGTWTLWWSAYEVVGADTFAVPGEGVLTTVAAVQPPSPFAVDDVARIRVNADGEAEWVVFGANPRGGVIPSTVSR